METNLKEVIESGKRGNIRYIYPGENTETIAKMISALANVEGGKLLLGVSDDGINIDVKGYSYETPNYERLSKILDSFESFTITEYKVNELRVAEIDVQKEEAGVPYNGVLYEFFNDYHNEMREMKRVKIFISYNHATTELADTIQQNLEKSYGLRVIINRDTQLEYRDDIESFMQSIKENDIIVSLITRKYLESEACMYEVTELMRDEAYSKRLAFIIISEKDLRYTKPLDKSEELLPQIYGEQRFNYIIYWNDKKRSYANRMMNLMESPTAIEMLAVQIRRTGRITDEIGYFLELLNKLKGQDFSTMHENDFMEIKKMIDLNFSN